MDPADGPAPTTPPAGFVSRLAGYAANALRYWEPRRALYNGGLALVVLGHFLAAWPGSYAKLDVNLLLVMFFLAVLANVCYCAAYLVDLFVQFAGLDAAWAKGRAALLIIGTGFAGVITHFLAMGMFP